jgi:hypothetical protein
MAVSKADKEKSGPKPKPKNEQIFSLNLCDNFFN